VVKSKGFTDNPSRHSLNARGIPNQTFAQSSRDQSKEVLAQLLDESNCGWFSHKRDNLAKEADGWRKRAVRETDKVAKQRFLDKAESYDDSVAMVNEVMIEGGCGPQSFGSLAVKDPTRPDEHNHTLFLDPWEIGELEASGKPIDSSNPKEEVNILVYKLDQDIIGKMKPEHVAQLNDSIKREIATLERTGKDPRRLKYLKNFQTGVEAEMQKHSSQRSFASLTVDRTSAIGGKSTVVFLDDQEIDKLKRGRFVRSINERDHVGAMVIPLTDAQIKHLDGDQLKQLRKEINKEKHFNEKSDARVAENRDKFLEELDSKVVAELKKRNITPPRGFKMAQSQRGCGQVIISGDKITVTDESGVEIRHWEKEDWQDNPNLVPRMVDDSIKASHCSLPGQRSFGMPLPKRGRDRVRKVTHYPQSNRVVVQDAGRQKFEEKSVGLLALRPFSVEKQSPKKGTKVHLVYHESQNAECERTKIDGDDVVFCQPKRKK